MTRDRHDLNSRADQAADYAANHPWRLALKVAVGIIVLLMVLGIIGLIGGWFKGETQIRTFDNAKAQATAVRDDLTSMEAIADTSCNIKVTANSQQFVEDPLTAYRGRYNQAKADYDRRMSNKFEAEKIRGLMSTKDLPDVAPTLDERLADLGCEVAR